MGVLAPGQSSRKREAGIYCIFNSTSGKVYVGQSDYLNQRWRGHRNALERGDHSNQHLQRAWTRDGREAFSFQVLEYVADHELLNQREQYWVDVLQATDRRCGYNMSTIPCSNRRVPKPSLQGEHSYKAILTDADVVNIRRRILFGESQRSLAKEFGINESTIHAIRNGRSWKHVLALLDEAKSMSRTTGTRDNHGLKNPRAKLTPEDLPSIRRMFDSGMTNTAIAKLYDVPKGTIGKVRRGIHWITRIQE